VYILYLYTSIYVSNFATTIHDYEQSCVITAPFAYKAATQLFQHNGDKQVLG